MHSHPPLSRFFFFFFGFHISHIPLLLFVVVVGFLPSAPSLLQRFLDDLLLAFTNTPPLTLFELSILLYNLSESLISKLLPDLIYISISYSKFSYTYTHTPTSLSFSFNNPRQATPSFIYIYTHSRPEPSSSPTCISTSSPS